MKNTSKSLFQRGILFGILSFLLIGCASFDKKINQTVKPLEKKLMKLTQVFSEVDSYEDLEKRRMRVRKLYLDISEEMIKAHAKLSELNVDAKTHSDELYLELERLYQIEGIRELLEEIQKDALIKWDQAQGLS